MRAELLLDEEQNEYQKLGGEEGSTPIHLYPQRWSNLALYGLLSFANGATWVTFAPISSLSQEYLGNAGSTLHVNMLSIVFLICYPVGTALEMWIFKSFQLRNTVLVAALLTALGTLIRLLIGIVRFYHESSLSDYNTFEWILLGQFLCALAQPIFLNLPAKLSSTWFGIDERDTSTTIAEISNIIGNAIGAVVASVVVTPKSHLNESFMYLFLGEFVFSLIPFLVALCLFAEKPPTEPSNSEKFKNALWTSDDLDERAKLKELLSDDNDDAHTDDKGGGDDHNNSVIAASDVSIAHSQASQQTSATDAKEKAIPPALSLFNREKNMKIGIVNNPLSGIDEDGERKIIDFMEGSRKQHKMTRNEEGQLDYGEVKVYRPDLRFRVTIMYQICKLMVNPQYWVLVAGFSFGIGLFNALLTLINQMMEPCGYSTQDAGIASFLLIGGGLIGAYVVISVLRTARNYNSIIKLGFSGSLLSLCGLISCLNTLGEIHVAALYAAFTLLGFFMLPMLPVVVEVIAEIVYPHVNEDIAVGILLTGGGIVGTCITIVGQILLEAEATHRQKGESAYDKPSNIFFLCCGIMAFCIILTYKVKSLFLSLSSNMTVLAGSIY